MRWAVSFAIVIMTILYQPPNTDAAGVAGRFDSVAAVSSFVAEDPLRNEYQNRGDHSGLSGYDSSGSCLQAAWGRALPESA